LEVNYKSIRYKTAIEFLLPRHYSGRKPNVVYSFGAYSEGELIAVCTYGIPASRPLCVGVMGKESYRKVIELNRLYVLEDKKDFILSQFVSWTLRTLKTKNLCVVSYADTAMSHVGSIYQACNFLYTGKTPKRTDKFTEGNKHCRHYDKDAIETKRKVRSAKHRYIYFTGSKTEVRKMKSFLNYKIQPYPKGKKENYKEEKQIHY